MPKPRSACHPDLWPHNARCILIRAKKFGLGQRKQRLDNVNDGKVSPVSKIPGHCPSCRPRQRNLLRHARIGVQEGNDDLPCQVEGLDEAAVVGQQGSVARRGLTFADPTRHLSGGRGAGRTVLPMTAEEIRAAGQAAVSPAQRLAIALAGVHAARPKAIRELTLDDIDLPSRRITIAGHRQRLGELTCNALLAWLGYRRATWPNTANRHVLVSRISALGTRPVSPDYLDKHQPRGVCLEHIRRDRILQEALATGVDPLHLALVFNIDHTNAMAYANAARNLLSSPAEQA